MPQKHKRKSSKKLSFKFPKRKIKEIQNPLFRKLIISSLVVNTLVILLVIFVQSYLPPQVPLYYGLARGQEQLADKMFLVIPGAISIFVLIVNTLFAFLITNNYLKKLLLSSVAAITILTTITTIKIIFLVGSF